jgi:hypothetical protein
MMTPFMAVGVPLLVLGLALFIKYPARRPLPSGMG